MTFNTQIDIGQILSIGTFIVTAAVIIATVRAELSAVKDMLTLFGTRLGKHEETVFNMAQQLQRLIGQVETRTEGDRRRRQNHNGHD